MKSNLTMKISIEQIIFTSISSLWISAWYSYPDEAGMFVSLTGFIFTYYMLNFLNNIGKRIVILDLLELLAIMQWLFFPALYYLIQLNRLVDWQWWYLQMQVPIFEYFNLALPSTIGLLLGIRNYKYRYSDLDQQAIVKSILTSKLINGNIGLILFLVGGGSHFIKPFVPFSFEFILSLIEDLVYIGIIYIYFSDLKYKGALLAVGILWTIYKAVSQGMFGIAIWWPAMILIIITMNKKINISLKISAVVALFLAFSVIQSVKNSFTET